MKDISFSIIIIILFLMILANTLLPKSTSTESDYLPSPDEIQQMINKRLPPQYRIPQDGKLGHITTQALIYVLTPEDDRKYTDWQPFLETIRVPEMEIK